VTPPNPLITPRPARATGAPRHAARALACALILPLLATQARPARAEGAADPATVLDALREKQRLKDQQDERDFARLIEQGRALLADGAYDQARQVLSQAAKARPGDEAAARLLAQAEAGLAAASPQGVLNNIRQEQHGKNAMLQVQLAAGLFEAEKALKAGDHARAIEQAQRALDGAGYLTDPDRAAKLRAQAQAILASARTASDRAKASELQALIAAGKDKAAADNAASLASLTREGWTHLEKGDTDKALAVADAILRLDPAHKGGLYLRQEARAKADSRKDLAGLRAERTKAQDRLLLDHLEDEMALPQDIKAKVVVSGKRGTKDFDLPDRRSIEPWEAKLRAKLQQPIEVEFRDTTLAEACRHLARVADCTIMVDPKVLQDHTRHTLPKMTNSLENHLRWLCRFGKATYTIRDHAILVTTHGGLLDQPITKDYDITSLLIPTRCVKTTFSGGTQADAQKWGGRETLGATRPAKEEETTAVSDDALGEAWAQFLRTTVAPETWEDPSNKEAVRQQQTPYTIQYRNGRIVVVHTPEVHQQIESLLNDFRKARNLQVHILARFLVVQTDFLDRFDLDLVGQNFDITTDDVALAPGTGTPDLYGFVTEPLDMWQTGPNPPKRSLIGYVFNDSRVAVGGEGELDATGPLQISWSHVGDNVYNALFSAVLKKRKGTILSAPRLTCFNTQRANFQAVTNFNYIRSINSDGEPEIGNVPDGIIFDVQPFVSTDRRYITLVLQPQQRTLRNRSFQNEGFLYALGGIFRQVNLPDTELRSVATTVTVPDGGTMLVGGLSTVRERSGDAGVPIINRLPLIRYLLREWTEYDSRQSLLVLVTAEIVPDIFEE